MLDVRKMFVNMKYQFSVLVTQHLTLLFTLMVNLAVSLIVTAVKGPVESAGSLDVITYIWGLMYALFFFGAGLKFSLMNGTSRKNFYLSSVIMMVFTALSWALITFVVSVIAIKWGSPFIVFTSIYAENLAAMFFWFFAATLLFLSLGFLVSVFFYRFNMRTKIITVAALVVAAPVLVLINLASSGGFFRALGRFFGAVLGLSGAHATPWFAVLFFIGLAAVFSTLVYFLVRRIDIKA